MFGLNVRLTVRCEWLIERPATACLPQISQTFDMIATSKGRGALCARYFQKLYEYSTGPAPCKSKRQLLVVVLYRERELLGAVEKPEREAGSAHAECQARSPSTCRRSGVLTAGNRADRTSKNTALRRLTSAASGSLWQVVNRGRMGVVARACSGSFAAICLRSRAWPSFS